MKRIICFIIASLFILPSFSVGLAEQTAYEKWLAVKDMEDYSDQFYSLKDALKTIKNGLDTGKTGTKKFKEACSLLFGENTYSKMSVKDIEKAYKSAKRYITGDVDGLQNGIDDMYKAGILTKAKDGHYSFTNTATVEEISELFGLSKDITELYLLSLTDYGWTVDFALNKSNPSPTIDFADFFRNLFSTPAP